MENAVNPLKQQESMDRMRELQEKLLLEMDSMEDCCRSVLGMAIDLADLQAQEMDRFWKAIGLHNQDISIDDAIALVTGWKEKAMVLRDPDNKLGPPRVDIPRVRKLLRVEAFDDDGVACCTVSVSGLPDKHHASGRTFSLNGVPIEHVLDSVTTILWLHEHFVSVVGNDYLSLLGEGAR